MLPFVPVAFDVYRPLKPRLRWAMACLVSFADRAGRCFPSIRKLAAFAGLSKSAVSRHLRDLVECGAITRQRRPGGVYDYEIDLRFLPRAPVSHPRAGGVPRQTGQETDRPKQTREVRGRARFAKPGLTLGEVMDDRTKWEARLRGWRNKRFWLLQWGAKPGEAGCMVPAVLLAQGSPC